MVIVLSIMVLTCPAAAQGILFIDVTDSQDPVIGPTPSTYTINYAFDPHSSGASIIDHLPFGLSFDSATGSGIYDSTTCSVLWDVSETPAGSVSVTVTPDRIPLPLCGEEVTSVKIQNTAVITMILPIGPESASEDEFTTIRVLPVGSSSCIQGPEFPSAFLPATMIIGFLGAVLLIQRTREH